MPKDYHQLSREQSAKAQKLIETGKIVEIWQNAGASINLVGSLRLDLLAKHNDIDFHVYTEELDILASFNVIGRICANLKVSACTFADLSETPEACFEWHIKCFDEVGKMWQIDIIQIKQGSPYDGYFEKVADQILREMSESQRETILKLKFETPETVKICGIEYYKAVIQDGVTTLPEMLEWKKQHNNTGIIEW